MSKKGEFISETYKYTKYCKRDLHEFTSKFVVTQKKGRFIT